MAGDENDTLRRRIDELEMRMAHQDRTVEDLNATITAQWKEIEGLTRRLLRLEDQIRDIGSAPASNLPEPPPPHY
jgi:SlyX protein